MNMLVGSLTFVPLLMVSVAHFFWSLGVTWPIKTEQLLAQTVVGRPGIKRMPRRISSFIVSVLVLAIGVVALALADHDSGGIWLTLLGAAFAAIFIARGVLTYLPIWREQFPTEPFATLDRKNYGPLCFWIGAGFAILVLMRLI
jgi:predicted lysophospholipase L1 biosynthesis ABC-type transport system permease subunit